VYVRALCVYASACVYACVHVSRVLCVSAMQMHVRVLGEGVWDRWVIVMQLRWTDIMRVYIRAV